MRGRSPKIVGTLLAGLLVLPGSGAAALTDLTGTVDYELGPPAPALDNFGNAWTIDALGVSVDFDSEQIVLNQLELTPGVTDFNPVVFTTEDLRSADLDLVGNFVLIEAVTDDIIDPDVPVETAVTIVGQFTDSVAGALRIDELFVRDAAFVTRIRPQAPITLEAGGAMEDPLASVIEQRNAGEPDPALREGDQVNAATGNLYRAENDVPEVSPSGLHFTRHYNSRSPLAGHAGWLHTYASFIEFDVPGVDNGVLLVRPDGEALLFYDLGGNVLAERPEQIPDDVPAVGTAQFPLEWTGSEWRFLNESGALEIYDEQGRLTRIVRRNGFAQTVHRKDGQITHVSDDSGRTLEFVERNSDGRLTRLKDPAGNAITYHYTDGRLTGVTRQDGTQRTYHYGEGAAPVDSLTGITDENRTRFATWEYDSENRVVIGERAGGAGRVELDYLDDGRVHVKDANGGERTYTFTRVRGKALPTSVEGDICNDCGKAKAWDYNELGLPTGITNPRDFVTRITYDDNDHGLEIQRIEASDTTVARTTKTAWDTELRLPRTILEPGKGKETSFTYDSRGRLLTRTETDTVSAKMRTTTRTYHHGNGVPGQLASIDGPRTDVDDVTTFAYDSLGNRTSTTNALGHATQVTRHDDFGRPLEAKDRNGLITRFDYDNRGRLISRNVGGEVTRFGYDDVGNRTSVERPDGGKLLKEYDPAHRLVAVEDEQGDRIEYELDPAGNRLSERVLDGYGAEVRLVQRTFDMLGRVTKIIGAAGQVTKHSYDENGNRTSTTDPSYDTTTRTFDALDRLIEVIDPESGTTSYQYNGGDQVVLVTDPRANTIEFGYNGFGDRVLIISPDSGKTTFEHDAAGNVITRVDAEGQRSRHAYDALNRLTRSEYADGMVVDHVHDEGENAIGRLVRISEGSPDWLGRIASRRGHDRHERGWQKTRGGGGKGRSRFVRHALEHVGVTTEWGYDRHGRVLERRQRIGGTALVTRHAYDDRGRRAETEYPSGVRVTFDYAADRVVGIDLDGEPLVNGVTYQPFGPASGWIWGDGDVHERRYDSGRLVGQTLAGSRRALSYTEDGNVRSIMGDGLDRSYMYDGLDRLFEASDRDPVRLDRYEYDATGNRVSRRMGDRIESYVTDMNSNRLEGVTESVGGSEPREIRFTYDSNGNLVDDAEHRYAYSARGRLIAVDHGKIALYRHNALGQRVFKRAEHEVDFLALAETAEARGKALADEAAKLRDQAHGAERDAADARRRAAEARADRDRARLRLEQAEAEARLHRRIGDIWQRISDRFAERAERLRDRIVEPARSWWQRLRNWIYRWLASIYEYLAERFAAFAEHRFAQAEAAEERAAEAQVDLARAEARLAEAERQLAEAERRAERLRAAAADKQAAADEQFRRAAEFRRLAEKGATRTVKHRFVHGEEGRLLGRYTGNGEPQREYIRLGDIPVAVLARGHVLHVHADHRNTPRLVSEPDGDVIWSWISAPFGDTAPNEDPDEDDHAFNFNLRFPGHYFDAETGWHQVGERSYDPGVGRFVSSGAAGADAGGNPFVYHGNNPVGTAGTARGGP